MFSYLSSFPKAAGLAVIFDHILGDMFTFDSKCCAILARSDSLQGLLH